jgi:hypothetical protein
MSTSYEDDLDDLDAPREREISLGAATILGIFLGLTLVCALFFGLGFSMGRRSALSAAATATPAPSTRNHTHHDPAARPISTLCDYPDTRRRLPGPRPRGYAGETIRSEARCRRRSPGFRRLSRSDRRSLPP